MKRLLNIACIVFLFPAFCLGQSVGINTSSPDPSAVLDISHHQKGLLIPRIATPYITSILNPAKGLMVYDSSLNMLMVNMGIPALPNWQNIVASSEWALTGNTGTDGLHNFIGTTDYTPLLFKVNNVRAGLLDPTNSNTSFGYNALGALTSGSGNTATGYQALASNTSGILNTASGTNALFSNSSGLENTAIGYNALYANSVGIANIGVGVQALGQNTSGNDNVAVGYDALYCKYIWQL